MKIVVRLSYSVYSRQNSTKLQKVNEGYSWVRRFCFLFFFLFIQFFSPDKWRRDSVWSGLAANESHSHRASMSERWRRVEDEPGVTFEKNMERKRPWEQWRIERHALPVGFHPRPRATITSLASRIKWPWNWPSFRDFYSFVLFNLTGPEGHGNAQQKVAEGRHVDVQRRMTPTRCFWLITITISAPGTPRKSRATTESNQRGRCRGDAQAQWRNNALVKRFNKTAAFF